MRKLLSNSLLFVYEMYENKSLALYACDLIFTIDIQIVNCYSLLELIYFLIHNNQRSRYTVFSNQYISTFMEAIN